MKKLLKIAGITAGALTGLLIVAFLILKMISDDQYKEWINSGVQSATGRNFSIGNLDLDLNTSLWIRATDVRMANAGWGSKPDMLTAGELEAEVSLISLLGGVAEVRTVVKQATVFVEKNAEGTSNWSMGSGAPEEKAAGDDADAGPDEGGLPIRPLIREFRIEDFVVTLLDHPGAQEKTARIENLLIETPQTDTTLSLAATLEQIPVELSGNLGPVSEVLDRQSAPLKLDGKLGDSLLGISGSWGPLMSETNMDLNLKVKIPSTAQMLSLIGVRLKELGVAEINLDLAAKDGQFAIARILTDLDGDVVAASVKGSISDLIALEGIDITAQLQTSGLNKLLERLNVSGIPVDLPPNVAIVANIHGSLDRLGVRDFIAKVRDEGVVVQVAGTAGNALYPEGIDAIIAAEVASTASLSKYAGLDIPDLGALNVSAQVTSKDKVVSLSNLVTKLVSDNININITGAVEDLIAVSGIEATLDTEISSLTAQNISEIHTLLKQFEIQVPLEMLPKSASLTAEASGDLDQLGVNNIKAEIRDEGILVTLAGSVADAMGPEGVDATLGFTSESTTALSRYAGMELPELGSVSVSGKLRSENKTYLLEDLDARLDGGNITLNVSGGVNDLVGVSGIDGRMELDIDSLTERNLTELAKLLEQLEVEAPLELLPAAARLHASAAGDLEQLQIKDIDAEIRDEGVVVALQGGIENAITQEGIHADVIFNSDSLAALSKYAQRELPESGPLDVAAKVTSKGKVFTLENLDAKLDADEFNVALNAGINEFNIEELMTDDGVNIAAISGINAELDSTVNSLDVFSELAQSELPATDPITLNAKVNDGSEGGKKTAKATVKVQTGEAKLALEGLLADLTSVDHLDVSILVEADSMSDFDKLAQSELPDKGPLKLTGTARARPDEYSLDDFQLTLDDQSANGFVGIKMAESEASNHTIEGELNIPYLDLSPLRAGAPVEETPAETEAAAVEPATKDVREEQEIAAVEETVQEASDKLFSTDPLPLEVLRKINADFSVTAQRLVLGKTEMSDLNLVLKLEDGLLRVDPIKSLAGIGTIDGTIRLDGRSDVAKLGVDIVLDDIPMPNLGGGLDSKFKIDGDGASSAELMGGLDGQIIFVVRDGTIPHSFATNFGSGLFSFSGGKDETKLECGVLRLDIEDGLVDFDDKLAVQLSDVTWRGGGEINLKTEDLDVGIAPKPRKGVGISAGSLASLVQVGGTLKNPSIQLDPKDVAVKYGKYMAAISTGGLSILAGALFDKTQANQDVCEAILSGAVFDEDPERAASESPTGEPETEAEKKDEKPMPKNLQ